MAQWNQSKCILSVCPVTGVSAIEGITILPIHWPEHSADLRIKFSRCGVYALLNLYVGIQLAFELGNEVLIRISKSDT